MQTSESKLQDSVISFVEKSNSDLLVYYAKDHAAHLNENDVVAICNLISHHKSTASTKLNILLHTLGGNINAAIGLVEYLKNKYPDKINSIVMHVAKSSGAFIAVSAADCYMHTGSNLSDFTLDTTTSTPAYTEAQRRSTLLAFGGICGKMDHQFWFSNFIFNSNPHGKSILKKDLLEHGYVKRLADFSCRTKALAHIHNEIINKFEKSPTIKKIYGFNNAFYTSST